MQSPTCRAPGNWCAPKCCCYRGTTTPTRFVYMKTFADMHRAMPTTIALAAPPVASPRGSGRPVVVLHLEAASGFELSALQLAADRLVHESHAAHISELVMVDTGNPWQPVIDELLTGSSPPVRLCWD